MSESVPSESPPSSESSPRSSRQRLVIWGIAGLLAYAVLGFFAVPAIVESQLVSVVEEQLDVTPKVETISFNPFSFSLRLAGFELPGPSGVEALFAFEELIVDVRPLGFVSADAALDEIFLLAPRVSAVVDETGEMNIVALLARLESGDAAPEEVPDPESEAASPLVVDIGSIRIERGEIAFLDGSQVPPFEAKLAPLDLSIDGFTTRSGLSSPYSLVANVGDSTRLEWSGTLGLEPLRSEGEISLEGFNLRMPWDYISDQLRFEISRGAVHIELGYALDLTDGLALSISGARFDAKDFEVLDSSDGGRVLAIPSASVSGIDASVDEGGLQSLRIADVSFEGGQLETYIETDGRIRLLDLLEPSEPAIPPDAAEQTQPVAVVEDVVEDALEDALEDAVVEGESEASSPEIRVDRVALAGFEIEIEDRGPFRPVPIRLSSLDLEILDFRTTPGSELTVRFSSTLGDAGGIAISGPVALDPLATRLAIDAKKIALGDFQPYMDDVARVDLPKGSISAQLAVDVRDEGGEAPRVVAKGRIQLDDLLAIDRRLARKFLELESLRVEGIDFAPEHVRVDEVAISGAIARVALDRKGRSNLEAIFGGEDGSGGEEVAEPAASDPDPSSAEPLSIEIGKVTLDGIGAEVDDRSVDPSFKISLDDLSGTIEGLSSDSNARAKVALGGRVDDVAPVKVAGQINPLAADAYTDLEILIEGVSLPAFTPYSGRFVGYRIDRGKLGLDLHYKLNGRRLEATNDVALRQFEFGDRVESEEATTLPVSLAIAVMRDPEGNIEIPLPIKGNLDDPSFSVLGLLGKALTNVVKKVAAAPFGAIAGLVGISGDELARVSFDSGSTRLTGAEDTKLSELASVLADRPSLRLEIRGRADPEVDGRGLRIARIEEEVQLAAFQSFSRRKREQVGSPSAVELDPEERLELLERIYRERTGGRVRDLLSPEESGATGADRTLALSEAAVNALAAELEIDQADWRALARARAASVQMALLETDRLSADRVFLVDVEVGAVGVEGAVPTELALRAD